MPASQFFTPDAKAQTVATIKSVEAETSAEVVVAVRHRATAYREADYELGFLCALGTLLVLLYSPRPFPLQTMPIDLVVVFALAAYVCSKVPALGSALTSRARKQEAVGTAARAAFVALGISRTKGRNGILVFVSMLERAVEVVPDVGIDPAALGDEWKKARAALESSLRPSPDLPRFLANLKAIGPVLGRAMPHRADDVNELPDEVA